MKAPDRMVQNAAAMGANAVTMMRFDSTEMGRSMSEIVAYGTARVVEYQPTAPDSTGAQATCETSRHDPQTASVAPKTAWRIARIDNTVVQGYWLVGRRHD